jgi:hypothetical protein
MDIDIYPSDHFDIFFNYIKGKRGREGSGKRTLMCYFVILLK